MLTAYVSLYTWDWQPIDQVTVDLSHLERNGQIDRYELDDVLQRIVKPLLVEKGIKDVHLFVHTGDQATPEDLLEAAKEEHAKRGPDVESWGRNRRIKRPGPIDGRKFKLK
jgi:hypothetical protein